MATIGVSAKLEYENGSSYAEVYNCKTVNFPAFNVSSIDTTNLANTDFAMSFLPGMVDAGSITFTSEFTGASYESLQALIFNVLNWKVSAPSGEDTVVSCDGFLTKLDVSYSANDEVMINGEIKLTGLPEIEGDE